MSVWTRSTDEVARLDQIQWHHSQHESEPVSLVLVACCQVRTQLRVGQSVA
jgi:hypothetical protein